MPETPELQEEMKVVVPDFPLSAGDGPGAATMLQMEDGRRTQARREELLAELKRMAGTAAGEAYAVTAASKSAAHRQRILGRKVRELQAQTRKTTSGWEGPCVPATVVNFNPIELRLYGQLQRWTLGPSGGHMRVEVSFRGRHFVGSYMTVQTPEVWPSPIGVDSDPVGDSPRMEAMYIPPVGIAHQFYSHYSEGASDAKHVGGILIFEGDVHTFAAASRRKDGRLKVPVAEVMPDGEVVYSTQERGLEGYLSEELDRQRAYAEEMIAQAHTYANSSSEIEQSKLTNIHKIWHNYALDKGYLRQAYPWASSKLATGPLEQVVKCPDCGLKQEDPNQYFCRNCNAPFDAYKAFMAGRQVPPDRLAVYAEDSPEFKEIVKEVELRKRRLAAMGLGDEPREPKRKNN